MKLTVFNGSPRGKSSNTKILLEHFIEGFQTTSSNTYELAYLNRVKDSEKFLNLFQHSECVLLAFPLYSSAMPAFVKEFIDSLEPLCGREGNPEIGFIVQGGLPEPFHSKPLERYLKKLAQRLGCKYKGTVIRGSVESIRSAPAFMNKRLFKSFYELGMAFGQSGEFNREILHKLAKPERMTKQQFWFLNLLANLTYWNKLLKQNRAFDKRFAKPYIADSKPLESGKT